MIHNAFEINRRIVTVMRLLGIGNKGLNLFCSLMDLTTEFYNQTYYHCLTNLHTASEAVYKLLVQFTVTEERNKTLEKENSDTNLIFWGRYLERARIFFIIRYYDTRRKVFE